jgi:hypothetical protein
METTPITHSDRQLCSLWLHQQYNNPTPDQNDLDMPSLALVPCSPKSFLILLEQMVVAMIVQCNDLYHGAIASTCLFLNSLAPQPPYIMPT